LAEKRDGADSGDDLAVSLQIATFKRIARQGFPFDGFDQGRRRVWLFSGIWPLLAAIGNHRRHQDRQVWNQPESGISQMPPDGSIERRNAEDDCS
jgi:hypothetical protein